MSAVESILPSSIPPYTPTSSPSTDTSIAVPSSSSVPTSTTSSPSLNVIPVTSPSSPSPSPSPPQKLTYSSDGTLLTNDPLTGVYEEIEIEDMELDEDTQTYYYPCPCGDKFFIKLKDMEGGETIATCPSCSLRIKVIYDIDMFMEEVEDEEEGEGE